MRKICDVMQGEIWERLLGHISRRWRERKNSEFAYPFTGRDYKDLRHFARVYQPWGVMALWDAFVERPDEFNKRTGWSIFQFTRQLPWLVDDPSWKSRARQYEQEFVRPLPDDLSALVDGVLEAAR